MLEGTNQFINDRIVIETIEKFDYLLGNDNFLDVPVSVALLDNAKVVSDDLSIADISKMMYGMSQPLVMYDDMVISPWDVCLALVTKVQ